jgi:hypothetical protein
MASWLTRQRVPAAQIRVIDRDREVPLLLGWSLVYIILSGCTAKLILRWPLPVFGSPDFLLDYWYVLFFKISCLLLLPLLAYWKLGYRLHDIAPQGLTGRDYVWSLAGSQSITSSGTLRAGSPAFFWRYSIAAASKEVLCRNALNTIAPAPPQVPNVEGLREVRSHDLKEGGPEEEAEENTGTHNAVPSGQHGRMRGAVAFGTVVIDQQIAVGAVASQILQNLEMHRRISPSRC